METLRDLVVGQLEAMPAVDSATWMDNAPPLNIFGLPEPVVPRGRASEQRFKMAKKKAVENPLIVGQLLSDDAKTAVISIGFDWAFAKEDADCTTRIVETAQDVLARHPGVKMEFSVTGPVPIRLMIIKDRASNEKLYQIIGYGIIVVTSIVLFRGLSVVFVVVLAPVIGLLWTLGFLRYFDLQDNPFSDVIVPMLVCLVGFTDAVRMMVFLRGQLVAGAEPIRACRNMLAAVGLACFLTSLTTAIGMGSLILAENDVVAEFGWACVIGVTTVWISVMLVIPLACFTPWAKRLTKGAENGHIERNLNLFGAGVSWVLKYPRLVSLFSFALLAFLGLIAFQLRPEVRTSNLMHKGSPAQVALAKLDKALSGLDTCFIDIDWEDAMEAPAPEVIAKLVSSVDEVLAAEPLVGHPLSLCRLLRAMPGEDPPEEKMSMIELLPPPLKLAVYDPENKRARVSFRTQDLGTSTYKPVFERIEKQLNALNDSHPGFYVRLADNVGSPVWNWKNLHQIVLDLITSLLSASIVIFVVLGIAFKSIRIGIISVVPNILPLAAAASFLVFIGKPLEMVSVCALTICLGIAVDDTIHFITRYQEEQRGEGVRQEKLQRAFQGVGTGMIMTSVVLCAGFGSVLTSNVPEHVTFAQMGVVTLVTALICDLFLLPAMLSCFDKDNIAS
ncbi:MAG: efflux RND transporter permease subunit [Pirellulales bacterium]